jgi:hypothetical protein
MQIRDINVRNSVNSAGFGAYSCYLKIIITFVRKNNYNNRIYTM